MRYKFCDFVVPFAVLALAAGSLQGGDWPTYRADALAAIKCGRGLLYSGKKR